MTIDLGGFVAMLNAEDGCGRRPHLMAAGKPGDDMKILHRISLNSKKDERFFSSIKKIGIKYKSIDMPGGKSQFVYFDITESDPNWPDVSQLVHTHRVIDGYDTFFTKSEILGAEWARLISTYSEGYPQPFDTWVINPI